MKNFDQMTVVATVSQPIQATPLQVILGSNGIDSELDGEHTVAADPLLSNAVGGVRLMVSNEDAARANEILAEHYKAEAEARAIAAKTCPECKSEKGIPVKRPLIVGILAVLTIGVFSLVYPWPRFKCPDCKHKWR